jgi:hypothetical protein
LKNVLYVPTITKKNNLSKLNGGTRFIGDIQPCGCFVEDMKNQGKFITKGKRNE